MEGVVGQGTPRVRIESGGLFAGLDPAQDAVFRLIERKKREPMPLKYALLNADDIHAHLCRERRPIRTFELEQLRVRLRAR
jgi:hypothetical protein